MTGPDHDEQRWSVGELARVTGVSVRMLRHFDERGLVSPRRSSGGHRCYRREDLTRLYRVLALRQMGLRLSEVAAMLAAADPSPRATLLGHLERIEASIAAQQTLRRRLIDVLAALDATSTVDTSQLMKVIEKMTMFDQHLNGDQRAWFTRRREQVGEQAWQDAIDQWPELVAAVRAEMDAGHDPADPRVQQLMTRWEQLKKVFLDDSSEMRTAAGRAWQAMWDQHADELRGSPRLAPPEMWQFIQSAQAASRGDA